MRTSRTLAAVVAAVFIPLSLSSCASAPEALSSAGQAMEAADGLIRAGADLAAACATAQAALVPGVSAEDARVALDASLGIVDGVLAENPGIPGVQELDRALASARDAVSAESSGTSLGVSRSTLEAACLLVTLGG
jgi:hypothetical protein